MISETTMKAIKEYAKYQGIYRKLAQKHLGKKFYSHAIQVMRMAVKLDHNGYYVHKIYNTGKIKIKVLSNDNPDARARLAYVVSTIWKENIHLEIAFNSNGTYIK